MLFLHVQPCGHDPFWLMFKVAQPQPPPSYPLFIQDWLPTKDGFCPLISKICQLCSFQNSPPSPNLFPTAPWKFWPPFFGLYSVPYIHSVPPQDGLLHIAPRFFLSAENRRPVFEGCVPPRGSIADLWGPPWEKNNLIGSMYGGFTYMWLIFMVNVGTYAIHGWYGKGEAFFDKHPPTRFEKII